MPSAAKTISLAPGLQIPLELATQASAVMAIRGWGKSYLAKLVAEGLYKAGVPIIAIDPVGIWYGLARDGKKPESALPIPVFGGYHGDIDISRNHGKALAEMIVGDQMSAVIDLQMFRKGDREQFCAEFGEELYHLKSRHRFPLWVLLEEAQKMLPQRSGGGGKGDNFAARMLGAWEDVVRLGRNHGLGCMMVSQRPQSVNKEALNQAEVLFLGRLIAKHERDAIKGWVQENVSGQELPLGELASLDVGEGFVWSPAWLNILKRVRFGQITTADTSSTPKVGAVGKAEPRAAAIDIDALRESFSAAAGEVEENKPAALRRQIVTLQKALKTAQGARAEAAPQSAPEIVEVKVPVLSGEDTRLLMELQHTARTVVDSVEVLIKGIDGDMLQLKADLVGVQTHLGGLPDVAYVKPAPAVITKSPPAVAVDNGDVRLNPSEVALLTALIQCGGHATHARTAIISGRSPKSSTTGNAWGALRRHGFATGSKGDGYTLADAGRDFLPDVGPLPVGEVLAEHWLGKLRGADHAVLKALVEAYPEPLNNEELQEATKSPEKPEGYSSTSSTLGNAKGKLRALTLIVDAKPLGVAASSDLVG